MVDAKPDFFTAIEHGPYRIYGGHTYGGASAPGVS